MLSDANLMLESESYRSAVDRAYYAMFHAARAALHSESVDLPKTHAGVRNLFGQHFLVSGKLSKDLGQWLSQAFRLRQQGDYEVHADVGEGAARDAVVNAEQFLKAVTDYIEKNKAGPSS
jgi:uncharacterized protein (UPF0332 family)